MLWMKWKVSQLWMKCKQNMQDESGIGVVEIILILVGNLPPYFEGVLCV